MDKLLIASKLIIATLISAHIMASSSIDCKTEDFTVETTTESTTEYETIAMEPRISLYEELKPEETETAPEYISLGEFKLTAYCSCSKCCGKWADNRPKDCNGNEIVIGDSGTVLEAGRSIAVDPTVIPYGTEVIINGHSYIAEDCGSHVKGNHIDIYFTDHEKALVFGVQYSEIFKRGE